MPPNQSTAQVLLGNPQPQTPTCAILTLIHINHSGGCRWFSGMLQRDVMVSYAVVRYSTQKKPF